MCYSLKSLLKQNHSSKAGPKHIEGLAADRRSAYLSAAQSSSSSRNDVSDHLIILLLNRDNVRHLPVFNLSPSLIFDRDPVSEDL